MITSKTLGSRISQAVIWVLVIAMALICLLPLLNMVAISFSSSTAASANIVGIYPVNPTLESYTKLLADAQFWRSFGISVLRVVLGASLNVLLTILMAYPLSKPKSRFKAQPIYMKFLLFTMLFSGGTIPIYLVVQNLGLVNSIWALILPTAVPVFNVIILMNFFKGTPDALEEAAIIDGAGQWTILFKIFLPISLPSLATVGLFSIVGHWNDYFIFRQPRITRCRPISASLRWTLPPLRIRKGCKSFHRFQTELLMQLKLLFLRCRYCVSIRFCRNISSQA